MADRDELLARHKAEKKALLAECQKMKHGIPKGDKKRKKEVMEEVARLETELEFNQKQELKQLDVDRVTEDVSSLSTAEKDEVTEGAAGNVITSYQDDSHQEQPKKTSRAQKRRDKKSAKDREREARLKEAAIQNLKGPRHQENVKLRSMLAERGLKIHQIPSDGNCMYSAVNHQLSKRGIQETTDSLRQKTAQVMRAKPDNFLPFLSHPDTGAFYTPENYEEYLEELVSTPAWGGQLELRALSESLSVPIEVVQAEGSNVLVGGHLTTPPIVIVYHRHALGLGEHYNSVVERDANDEDNEEEETR